MAQNQEIIEAKLCAYVDGELDGEGRAEIERHLEANPQHRRLLESLKATRDLLRWLPREPAPPEIAETLNGQLERSVLLDYTGDDLRISIWPRALAAAAIVLLTVGLAAAVYFTLPKSQKSAIPYAVRPEPEPAREGATSGPTEPGSNLAARLEIDAHVPPPPARAEKSAEAGGFQQEFETAKRAALVRSEVEKDSSAMLKQLAEHAAQNSGQLFAAADNAGNSANQQAQAVSNSSVVMLVHSEHPVRTERELTRYLTLNQISWKSAEASQTAGGYEAPAPAALDTLGPGQMSKARTRAPNSGANRKFARKDEGAAAPGAPSTGSPRGIQPDRISAASAQAKSSGEERRTASSAAPLQRGRENGNSVAQAGNLAYFNGYRGNNVYVARMSRRQAEDLTSVISKDRAQRAELKEVPVNEAVQEAPSQQHENDVDQLDPRNGELTQRERASHQAAIAPVPQEAAGPRDKNSATQPARSGASAGGDVLAANRGQDLRVRSELGAERAANQAVSTTQLAERIQDAGARDEPVDVVILVQPTDGAAGGPATQPARSVPSTQPVPAER